MCAQSPAEGCCPNPDLFWGEPTAWGEAVIVCRSCGFQLDPDGVLLDWHDPEEIEMRHLIEQRRPRIAELGRKMHESDWGK